MNKPTVVIIGTGGTIAGTGTSLTDTTQYTAGDVPLEEITRALPELADYAEIETYQLCNIDSTEMNQTLWMALQQKIEAYLKRGDVAGVVVTHGTDTMEETAYFLHLTVNSEKPVVLTGAMRPATARSADGPMNLIEAVRLAACPRARKKGVLVMMNDRIVSARFADKTNCGSVDTFKSYEMGVLGYVRDRQIQFYTQPVRRHTFQSELHVSGAAFLPRVDILYMHADSDGVFVKAAVDAGARGIVVAGLGNGNIPATAMIALRKAAAKGVLVVRGFRGDGGIVTTRHMDRMDGVIAADNLSPQKARVLLMLALRKTKDPRYIQRFFEEY